MYKTDKIFFLIMIIFSGINSWKHNSTFYNQYESFIFTYVYNKLKREKKKKRRKKNKISHDKTKVFKTVLFY